MKDKTFNGRDNTEKILFKSKLNEEETTQEIKSVIKE